ncbi:30S ribosomal protein S27ae [Candidatus Woesearchaeota archaeon]|nr:30S ribosomal protein S27ae [Candidatus Woesearchaeota archaeon]
MVERKPSCPKCGPGYFFADHRDRYYCGHCHFMQIKTK